MASIRHDHAGVCCWHGQQSPHQPNAAKYLLPVQVSQVQVAQGVQGFRKTTEVMPCFRANTCVDLSALLSQCADITTMACGVGKFSLKRLSAGPTCSGLSANMGEPCEINKPGNVCKFMLRSLKPAVLQHRKKVCIAKCTLFNAMLQLCNVV